ncbi:LuxR C-terminal-related transcriptional regulator [Lacihabitans sp. CCS-44]|uniref:LuxR C-terminal-related transcriptional regulator n=1 Tax=Lacihabitans sp. CCS-44 TaxID=2487331 RepID=UPI0020CCF9CB|nr:LuxR C-terminal-related transcriptional regulator [Lacihabitans sp. CCS-44]
MTDAQKVFEFRDFRGTLKYTGEVAYLIDTTFKINSCQIDKLSNLPISEKVIPDLGWGKFRGWIKLNAKSSKNQQLFLQIHNPVFDEINVYVFQKGKIISGSQTIMKGTLLRPNSLRLLTVPIVLEKDNVYQIYVSGISKFNPVKFPIRFLDQRGLDEFRDSENLYNGLMLGFMTILIILNILIFIFFKVRVFLFFSLSNISFLFLYLYLEGYLFGQKYSELFFENPYFNFQYLIYYGFQLFNFYFVWSIYRLYFLNKSSWVLTYNILISVCLIQVFLMFFSPLWEVYLCHNQIVDIGSFTRLGALLLNIFMLALILKTWREKPFSAWMLIAILPGWLSYVVPRFAAVFLHDSWVTLPFLYSVSSIWNVLFITIGLFLELSKNYKSKIEQESAGKVEVLTEPISQPKSQHVLQLSKRETEILKAFANGFSYQEISDAMFISPHTVRTHIKNIYNKLEINSKAEAVRWVIEHLEVL